MAPLLLGAGGNAHGVLYQAATAAPCHPHPVDGAHLQRGCVAGTAIQGCPVLPAPYTVRIDGCMVSEVRLVEDAGPQGPSPTTHSCVAGLVQDPKP
jgi:hypothetical protein